jgi:hypothetical protein
MQNTLHLTQAHADELLKQINLSVAGQAHFAGSGPAGTHCSQCAFLGYYQNKRNSAGEITQSKLRKGACAKYFELTNQHGPVLDGDPPSCRHFQPRPPAS